MVATLDQFQFHQHLATLRGPALVMFGSVDCGACRHLKRIMDEVARESGDWAIFEVDAQREAALTSEFEVFHLPTLFLFRDGDFHCELRAEARTTAIVAEVEQALSRPAEEAP